MKIGVIGIVIEKDKAVAMKVQELLSSYSRIILGRMGIPNHESEVNVISVIVKGSNEEISALTGKLGRLQNVKVKCAVTDAE